jgi:lysophospholipase L1-like esterase
MLSGWAAVWSPSESGTSSRYTLSRLDEWVDAANQALDARLDVVHINCCLHDLIRDRPPGAASPNRVPVEEYADNVRAILSRLGGTGARLIWALATPVNEAWHRERKPFDRLEADVHRYNEAAATAARQAGARVQDLHSIMMQAGRDELLLPDGVHYKPEGYRLLAQAVADCIRSVA